MEAVLKVSYCFSATFILQILLELAQLRGLRR